MEWSAPRALQRSCSEQGSESLGELLVARSGALECLSHPAFLVAEELATLSL